MSFESPHTEPGNTEPDVEQVPPYGTDEDRISPGGIILPSFDFAEEAKRYAADTDFSLEEVKDAIDYIYKDAAFIRDIESRAAFPVYDSAFEAGPEELMGNHFGFNEAFREVLGDKSVPEYLKEQYGTKSINVTEFGGPFREASKALERSGVRVDASLGVTLLDMRDKDEQWEDAADDHTVLAANIFALSDTPSYGKKYGIPGLEAVTAWVEEHGKLDFILSRLGGPLSQFNPLSDDEHVQRAHLHMLRGPTSSGTRSALDRPDAALMRTIFLKAALHWYDYLAEGGTMLIDCPGPASEIITDMLSSIQTAEGGPAFAFSVHDSAKLKTRAQVDITTTQLLLRRLPGSPDHIPLSAVRPKV